MPIYDRPTNQQYDRRVGLRMPAMLYAAMERRAREQGLPLSTVVRAALQHEVEAR
jgi:predicted DNA binding CopG/RHH family protein